MRIVHYFDYKSPYAYLAQEPTFELARTLGVEISWSPYTLDIPQFLGPAELDAAGDDTVGRRNEHQWRRVRYIYMDCRRDASARGITLRGPRKVFDSSIAHIGFLYARRQGQPWDYHRAVFERFWRRELDIEDVGVVSAVLAESGIDAGGFADFLRGEGREEHDRLQTESEAAGVFGVPSYMVDDELFWGTERLPLVRERIAAGGSTADRLHG